jgi:hypothetical protein
MNSPRDLKGVRSAMFSSIALVGMSVFASHDAVAAPTCPAGPGKPAPAGCAAPTDKQCADATGPYSSTKNPACADAWSEHCACVNTYYYNQARQPLATPANLERSPSPTKGVYSSDPGKNSVHVSNYGVRTDWLQGAQPRVAAQPVSTTIGTVPATNVGAPTTVAAMSQHALGARSQHFYGQKKIPAPKAIPKSMQNIWGAHDTYAHADAVARACPGKTGDDLVTCAKGYTRKLHATSPKVADCEDFVYNRFYDVEAFEDHMAACRGDVSCKAAIALDKDVGIAGRGLTGSDVEPGKRDLLKKLFRAFDEGAGPNCDAKGINAGDLQLCELANSIPPIAFVRPTYQGPISGGGLATTIIKSNGDVLGIFDQNPTYVGYYMSRNPFYDAASIVTPLVMQSFVSDPAKYASLVRLANEVKKGSYYVGKSFPGKNVPGAGVVASFPDEWTYERHMHNAVKNQSVRAIRDFEKRKNFLKQRGDTFTTLFYALPKNQLHFKIPGPAVDANLTATSLAGFGATRALVPSATQMKPTVKGALPAFKTVQGQNASLVPIKPNDMDYRSWGSGGKPPPMDPAYKYPRLLCGSPDKLQNGFSARQVGSLVATGPSLPITPINGPAINHAPSPTTQADVTTAACNLVNAVLDEWARADSPKILAPNDTKPLPAPTGCFANDLACDWDPATFVRGVTDMVHNQIDNVQYSQREADYKACKAWQPIIAKNMSKFSDQNNGELLMLGDIKTEIQQTFNEISDVPVLERGPMTPWANQVPMKPEKGDTFATFGEDRHNAEVWGNDMFGVGYSYDIGWEVPVRWEQVEKDQHTEVCDFGLGAHGGFEAYAFAFGSDKFDILAADLVAGVHDYTNPTVPGADAVIDTNLHDAAFDAHFVVAGDSIVAEDEKVNLNAQKIVPFASGANSWNLFTIPFQISFVTLEMSVGIGYSYSVDMKATPSHTNVCHEGKKVAGGGYPWAANHALPTIALNSTLTPQAELDGIVDAYASIAGLAGVGVDVNLTLLGLGLPAQNNITLSSKNLTIDSTLNMDFHTLDGSLSVYAELLFFTLFDIEIMSWDGYHSTIPLFNTGATVDIGALGKLGNTGLTNPAASLKGL